MFRTDLLAVLVLVAFAAIPIVGVWLVVRRDPAVPPLKRHRRSSDPQAGPSVAGTGSERGARRSTAADLAVLPRSHPAAGDPRPSAAGPQLPAVTVDAPRAVTAGHQPRRVWVHG
jgi:hypothetical protein